MQHILEQEWFLTVNQNQLTVGLPFTPTSARELKILNDEIKAVVDKMERSMYARKRIYSVLIKRQVHPVALLVLLPEQSKFASLSLQNESNLRRIREWARTNYGEEDAQVNEVTGFRPELSLETLKSLPNLAPFYD